MGSFWTVGKTKVRANGEGSVFFNASKGLWIAQVYGRKPAGGYGYRTKSAATQKVALTKLKELQAEVQRLAGVLPAARTYDLPAFLKRWLDGHEIRPSTRTLYERTLERHVYPYVRHLDPTKLDPSDIKALQGELRRKGVGARTRLLVHQILRAAFTQETRDGRGVVAHNPMRGLAAPQYERTTPRYYTVEQTTAFLASTEGTLYHALFVLLLDAGLREGEALALRPSDVDLETRKLRITRSLGWKDGRPVFGPPKTEAGVRDIVLSNRTIAALKAHRKRLLESGLSGNVHGLLFPSPQGRAMQKDNFLKRIVYPLMDRAGLPRITVHQLRHSAATRMLEAGVPLHVVQRRLGHSSISVTADTYAHVTRKGEDLAADSFDAVTVRTTDRTKTGDAP